MLGSEEMPSDSEAEESMRVRPGRELGATGEIMSESKVSTPRWLECMKSLSESSESMCRNMGLAMDWSECPSESSEW